MQAGREIKFRALHKSGKMLYFNGDSPSFGSYPGERFASVEDVFYYHKEDFHLMQFTGLRDKNGKEIYEGDILRDGLDNHRPVEWADYFGAYRVRNHGDFLHSISYESEVVGNVYEHRDLLQSI